ncbi:MAG: hypothetical protein QME74_02175 [Candidatus Edwardsbacteria bacterium]|nr:hypothetical protein [Candidatus Edwardsbacteria bacterium]
MKRAYILISALIGSLTFSIAGADTLTVTIKGLDDGKKTTRQRDYQEALLDAQRQAIEQAGVKIESKTTVINAQVQRDFIESQAKAVLLPGFQVIDIGYTADKTYQVVLSGKILMSNPESNLGTLVLCMSNYAIPISISLGDGPIDATQPFQVIALTPDSGNVKTYGNLRAFKKDGYGLCRYFLYVSRLKPGTYTVKCQANVTLGGGEAEQISKQTAVEVKPGQYAFYEYLAHPNYSFSYADKDFLYEQMTDRNNLADTTAAFRETVRQRIAEALTKFAGRPL